MDLARVVRQMRLDAYAVDVSECLTRAGLPHALIKGPTTAQWLYDPPRNYVDVDLLVPPSRLPQIVAALAEAGLAESSAGRVGEEASHSLLLRSPAGIELDVHVTLPMLTVSPGRDIDRTWQQLKPHLTTFALGERAVPALGETARGLVVALHALGSGQANQQAVEDLRRLRAKGERLWSQVEELAASMEVRSLVRASLVVLDGGSMPADIPADVALRLAGASGAAFQLARIQQAPWRERPALLVREALPSRGFMRYASGKPDLAGAALARAYMTRLARLARQLPEAMRSLRSVRRA